MVAPKSNSPALEQILEQYPVSQVVGVCSQLANQRLQLPGYSGAIANTEVLRLKEIAQNLQQLEVLAKMQEVQQ